MISINCSPQKAGVEVKLASEYPEDMILAMHVANLPITLTHASGQAELMYFIASRIMSNQHIPSLSPFTLLEAELLYQAMTRVRESFTFQLL